MRYLIGALFAAMIIACATTAGSLSGGDRDESPPTVILDESSPMLATNVRPTEIVLAFDEYVTLKNPYQQILISPPLNKRPEIETKGKSVRITLDKEDTLSDNTTYNIQFGNSIQDLNEGNPAKNLQYVFSTGPTIDSISISGKIIDAISGEAVENALISLYESGEDSLIFNERPNYATTSDENGNFTLSYLRDDTFYIYASTDVNFNYVYETSEQLAFADKPFVFPDSTTILLQMSQPTATLIFEDLDTSETLPYVMLRYNRPPFEIVPKLPEPGKSLFYEQVDNTIRLYMDSQDSSTAILWVLDTLNEIIDTMSIPFRPGKIGFDSQSSRQQSFHPANRISLFLSSPPLSFTDSLIRLFEDSTEISGFEIRIDSVGKALTLEYKWKEDRRYKLIAQPGAILGYNCKQLDSISFDFNIGLISDYGNYEINLEGLDSSMTYIAYLYQGKTLINQNTLKGLSQLRFPNMKAGTFELEIVEDLNRNGRWDPIRLFPKTQAEKRKRFPLEELRANWDIETQVTWN